MSDEINICLINNNEGQVENLSNFNVTGIKGESVKVQKMNIDLIKNNKAQVSGLEGVNVTGANFTKSDLRSSQQSKASNLAENSASRAISQGESCKDKEEETQYTQLSSIKSNYQSNFEELEKLGEGGFGAVFKVKDKFDEQIYAVKKITLSVSNPETIDFVLREVKTLAQISSDRVVRYFNSWMENNCIFIKMEFCSDNLKNTIQQKREAFKRTPNQVMGIIEYHISCQMLREILECVGYLHELNLIHRDLKPHNLLVLDKPNNGKYIKICDFGLAVFHDIKSMTHTEGVGTLKYMAPEISDGKYDLKADIYSLGRITEELFDVDIQNSESIKPLNGDLREKLKNLTELILLMTKTPVHRLRPTCAQVLDALESLSFDKNEIKIRSEFVPAIIQLNNAGKQIFLDYLK